MTAPVSSRRSGPCAPSSFCAGAEAGWATSHGSSRPWPIKSRTHASMALQSSPTWSHSGGACSRWRATSAAPCKPDKAVASGGEQKVYEAAADTSSPMITSMRLVPQLFPKAPTKTAVKTLRHLTTTCMANATSIGTSRTSVYMLKAAATGSPLTAIAKLTKQYEKTTELASSVPLLCTAAPAAFIAIATDTLRLISHTISLNVRRGKGTDADVLATAPRLCTGSVGLLGAVCIV